MNIFVARWDAHGDLEILIDGVPVHVTGNFRTSKGIITQWENKTNCVCYAFGTAKPDLLSHRSDWVAGETFQIAVEHLND
jgi:hypothetical protein